MKRQLSCLATWLAVVALVTVAVTPAVAAWEPTKPIEFVIPRSTSSRRARSSS